MKPHHNKKPTQQYTTFIHSKPQILKNYRRGQIVIMIQNTNTTKRVKRAYPIEKTQFAIDENKLENMVTPK